MMDREETHIEDKQPTVRWHDESMALHWIDRYASGVDGEPQMGRILACVEPAAIRSSPAREQVAEALADERDLFEQWAMSDHRNVTPERFEERSRDNNHYYDDDSDNSAYIGWCARTAISPSPTGGEAGAVDEADGAMTPEEVHLENLKQMAAYEGPIVSLDVRDPYYLASCDHCGWIGSSEHCGADSWGDDSDVYCPRCHASGADCGKIAASITHLTPLMREVEAVLSRAHQKMRTYVSVYPGDKELRELLADWSTLLTKLQEDGR